MSTKTSSIRIEYKPLSTSDSVTTLSGNQRQTYNVNTGYFHPDRRLDPLTLLVTCSISDPHNFVSGVINNDLTDIVWKITDTTGKLVIIQSTDKQFKIGTGVDKGKITIYKNIPDLDETTLEFTSKYIDPKTKRVVNFQKTFSIITVTEAVAQNQLQLNAPVGTVQFPFVNDKGLVLQADLMREGKKVPAAYWWKKDGKDLTELTDRLLVLDTIKNGNVYQVEVADCTNKFNELVSEKVEKDSEVIESRNLYNIEPRNIINQFNNNWSRWQSTITKTALVGERSVRVWKEKDVSSTAVGIITDSSFDVLSGITYKISFIGLAYYDNDIHTLYNYCYLMNDSGNIALDTFKLKKQTDILVIGNSKGYLMELEFKLKTSLFNTRLMIGSRRPEGSYHNPDYFGFYMKDIKMATIEPLNFEIWSPSKYDLEQLIKEKTDYYASQTTLPPGYRPTPKPTNLFKKEVLFKRSLGSYEVDILYPKVVDPDVTEVQFEAVFTNNRGIIANSSKWFDVGWWKKADGTYEYTGLKIKVPIAKLQSIIASGKGVEYTVIEK